MADGTSQPPDLNELGAPPGGAHDSGRSSSRPRSVVALSALVAVASILAAVALWIATSTTDEANPVGTRSAATIGQFDDALTAALKVLDEAPGIEGVHESYVQNHLFEKVWFSTRGDNDVVVVQQTDVDVRHLALSPTSAAPQAVVKNIETRAELVVNGDYYKALTSEQDSQPWSQVGPAPSGSLAFGLAFLDEEFGPPLRKRLFPRGTEVTSQSSSNGGEIWTLAPPSDTSSTEHQFYIHADGHLASWTWQTSGIGPDPTDPTGGIETVDISYQPLARPDELTAPEIGTALDLTALDLPEGFHIGE